MSSPAMESVSTLVRSRREAGEPVWLRVLSLGAGVQSSTLALLAAHGDVGPMPDIAIFADTAWEPAAVYKHLDWLCSVLPYPVLRVEKGNIRDEQITARVRGGQRTGDRWVSLPYYTKGAGDVREGMVRRQCTAEYKIDPIERALRTAIGLQPRQQSPTTPVVEQWRGISTDEASRMKSSRRRWMTVRYPLAMELRMSRGDCLAWMERHGYPRPPRSACIGCPYHSDAEWERMKRETPEEFLDAVEFDAAIRRSGGMDKPTYLHRSCRPLSEVEFDAAGAAGQLGLWGEECEGMCGV